MRVHSRREGAEQAEIHGARQAQVQRAIAGETGGAGNDQIGFQAAQAGRLDANFVAAILQAHRTGIFKIHVGIAERDAGKIGIHLQRFRTQERAGQSKFSIHATVAGEGLEMERSGDKASRSTWRTVTWPVTG